MNNPTLNIQERGICINSVWKHFKGDKYKILGFAVHTETGEEMVAYQRVNEHYFLGVEPRVYVRPLINFYLK